MSMSSVTLVRPQSKYASAFFKAYEGCRENTLGYDIRSLSPLQKWGVKLGVPSALNKFLQDYNDFNYANNQNQLIFWSFKDGKFLGEVSLTSRKADALKDYTLPQQEICERLFGKKDHNIIIPTIKMAPQEKGKQSFEEIFIGMADLLKKNNVKQFLINAPLKNKGLNRYFSTICKFCQGKALKTKNTIEYLLPPNVDKIREAFKELAAIALIKAKNGISAVLDGLKEMSGVKDSRTSNNRNILSRVKDSLLMKRERERQSGVNTLAIGYHNATPKEIMGRYKDANRALKHAKLMGSRA
ncbi:MAG: hypothetical protein PHE89_01750 [Alphaproteobacteria bacterium]|nr:hypothetical protein [Alphaproteobacteria bacterium]